MLINCFREKLLVESCCNRAEGGLIEIPNSVREKELKKIWVDCSDADDALLIRLEAKKENQLCPLFRRTGLHLKTCDGIILLAKGGSYHAVFCELKTTWDAVAIKQIRNSHLFFNYAHEVVKAWHGAPADVVSSWFAVIHTGAMPILKSKTKFDRASVPNIYKPSRNVLEPRRLHLTEGRGQSATNPLPVRELAYL